MVDNFVVVVDKFVDVMVPVFSPHALFIVVVSIWAKTVALSASD